MYVCLRVLLQFDEFSSRIHSEMSSIESKLLVWYQYAIVFLLSKCKPATIKCIQNIHTHAERKRNRGFETSGNSNKISKSNWPFSIVDKNTLSVCIKMFLTFVLSPYNFVKLIRPWSKILYRSLVFTIQLFQFIYVLIVFHDMPAKLTKAYEPIHTMFPYGNR